MNKAINKPFAQKNTKLKVNRENAYKKLLTIHFGLTFAVISLQ